MQQPLKTPGHSLTETMNTLKEMGTDQNVKIYKRHGAGENLFGVSFANLKLLTKKIKLDHPLAIELWATGNTDAQTLALMIADPAQLTPSQAHAWVEDISYHLLADYLAAVVARSAHAAKLRDKWMKSQREFIRLTGYTTLSHQLKNNADQISDEFCNSILTRIETEIHTSPNFAKSAMNMTLISIGIYKESLRTSAIECAKRIGKVQVDHGETNCKTPDAASYIDKAVNR